MTLETGTRLGPYEILGVLGAGGMGEVYRARDTRLGREVAVKVPLARLLLNPASIARFDREARAAASLDHPNVLSVHDVGEQAGVRFVVTELLVGETLRARLERGRLPWPRAVEIAGAVAEGLAAAHSAGLVHRDVKPENLFLTADGRVKVLDFGLAMPDAAGAARQADTTVTEENAVVGTLGYVSPERLRGAPADARSDLFAVGAVLYEMLAGRRAFEGGTAAEVWSAILTLEPTDLRELVPDVPLELSKVVERCLAKEPGARFQSARDLAFALRISTSGALPSAPGVAALRPRRLAAAAVIVAAAAALGVYLFTRAPRAVEGVSIAVLPFAGSGEGVEYLGDGLAENLINRLARLPGVRVAARASSFRFRDEADARKVGQKLGVGAVVTGRVARQADRVMVQVDLVDVARGTQLWGERYGRAFTDVLAVEDEVTREVVAALGARLTGADRQALERRETGSPEAYDLYLRGRFHAGRRAADGLEQALQLYGQALEKDPRYARAWCGLADTYNLVAFYGGAPPGAVIPKAKAAALKALELDERTAEAHVSLADILYQFDWDWAGAEREFRRAIELAPNAAAAHHWYSNFLSVASRFPESMAEIQKARSLDPYNPVIQSDLALAHYWAGRLDEAAVRLTEITAGEPSFPLSHFYLAVARGHQGRFDEAEEAVGRFEAATGGPSPDSIAVRGWIAARGGNREAARRHLAALQSIASERFVSAFPMAFVHAGLGDTAAALAALERAAEEKAGRLVYLKVERAFDPLRQEPRFQELLRRVRIPG